MIQFLEPPDLNLNPKPGKSSSKQMASALPAGNASLWIVACVSFTALNPSVGKDMGRPFLHFRAPYS
jgi:hypothetical protein